MEPGLIHLMGVGAGVAGAMGSASKMHLVIKTGCVHHWTTQLEEGQGWGRTGKFLALVSEPGHQQEETTLPHHFGLIVGKLDSPLSVWPQGAHMPRIPRSGFVLRTFDFKRMLLCRPNTTGLCWGPKKTRCALGGKSGSQHHPSSGETKRNKKQWRRGMFLGSSLAGTVLAM